LWGFQPT